MSIKFNQYWTIIPDTRTDYEKFILKDFIPEINKLGIHTVAVWRVLVGAYSQIIFEGVCSDLDFLEKSLRQPKYKDLNMNLLNYVKDYKTKVLTPTGRKDSYSVDISEETVKFTQLWDISRGKKEEYERFVGKEFYPAMEELDISIAGEWEVFIGDGPQILCEGRSQNIDQMVRNINSKRFLDMRRELHHFIENYSNRFLSLHIRKIKGYKSESYELVA